MMNNNFSNCEALPQIEMEFMNIVHCEELQLVGQLAAQLEAQAQADEIDQSLANWLLHTREHFEREEQLMDEYRFPPYPIHKMEHEQALDTLLSAQQNWLDTRDADALLSYIKQDWRNWLQQHIMTLDRVTAHFFKQMGVEVQL